MDAMSQTKKDEFYALELGKLIDDHRGVEVIVMDMRPLSFWTDFFVIATVNSSTHLSGLERHIKEYARNNELEIVNRSRRLKPGAEPNPTGSTLGEWSLLDLGNVVIHLMSEKSRQFFELERLWSNAPLIFQAKS
jgi:ribosome-associated protein